jgi:hypothetical protein
MNDKRGANQSKTAFWFVKASSLHRSAGDVDRYDGTFITDFTDRRREASQIWRLPPERQ